MPNMKIGPDGLAIVKAFESCLRHVGGGKFKAYVDPVGVVTVCAGHTRTAKLGQTLTAAQCTELLKQDVRDSEQAVKRLVKVPLTQNQFDALVSFHYNTGALGTSTLLKKLNSGFVDAAANEFLRWTKAKAEAPAATPSAN